MYAYIVNSIIPSSRPLWYSHQYLPNCFVHHSSTVDCIVTPQTCCKIETYSHLYLMTSLGVRHASIFAIFIVFSWRLHSYHCANCIPSNWCINAFLCKSIDLEPTQSFAKNFLLLHLYLLSAETYYRISAHPYSLPVLFLIY